MKIYENDYGGQYPISEQWCDLLIQKTEITLKSFRCPLGPENSFTYAINKNLYELEPNEVRPEMVFIFEADLSPNGIGDSKDLVLRHEQNNKYGCNIVYADGHVEFITEDHIADLQWTAEWFFMI